MGLIPLDLAVVGDSLGADVKSPQGRLLFSTGHVLDEKALRVLKTWGVHEVDCAGREAAQARAVQTQRVNPLALVKARGLVGDLLDKTRTDSEVGREVEHLALMRVAALIQDGAKLPDLKKAAAKAASDALHAQAGEADDDMPADPADVVKNEVRLATFPEIYHEIVKVLNDPDATAAKAAEVVEKDPGAAAALLRLVNSPFYGLPVKVESIKRAVILIGAVELSMLALGVLVIRQFKGISAKLINMEAFWRHAVACGVIARILAGQTPGAFEERFFVAGLIHDLGKLLLYRRASRRAGRALAASLLDSRPVHLEERERFGFDHAELGGKLLKQWKFPEALVDMTEHHHDPVKARNMPDAAVIHCADALAHVLVLGRDGPGIAPGIDPAAYAALGVPAAAMSTVLAQAGRQVDDIVNSFLGQDRDAKAERS